MSNVTLIITQGYLMVFKRNDTPNYNATVKNYDYLKVLCPNSTDVMDDGTDMYYLFFMNIEQIAGYKVRGWRICVFGNGSWLALTFGSWG